MCETFCENCSILYWNDFSLIPLGKWLLRREPGGRGALICFMCCHHQAGLHLEQVKIANHGPACEIGTFSLTSCIWAPFSLNSCIWPIWTPFHWHIPQVIANLTGYFYLSSFLSDQAAACGDVEGWCWILGPVLAPSGSGVDILKIFCTSLE